MMLIEKIDTSFIEACIRMDAAEVNNEKADLPCPQGVDALTSLIATYCIGPHVDDIPGRPYSVVYTILGDHMLYTDTRTIDCGIHMQPGVPALLELMTPHALLPASRDMSLWLGASWDVETREEAEKIMEWLRENY